MRDKIAAFWERHFGENQGVEAIAARLRSGEQIVSASCRANGELYEFRGTGIFLGGHGNQREYFIEFRKLLTSSCIHPNVATDWVKLSRDTWEFADLRDMTDSYFMDIHQAAPKNDEHTVVEFLRTIAKRLKPHQYYLLDNMAISADLFTRTGYRLYSHNRIENDVPHTMIGSRRLITKGELEHRFDPLKVRILDETKIAREHRADTDIKRWYTVKKVETLSDEHVIRFTHRNTAHAKVAYYQLAIEVDARNQAGKPFYVTEILTDAVKQLGKDYPDDKYHLEIFPANITITVPDCPKMLLDAYAKRQDQYPENRDHNPILINDQPVVRNTFDGWNYAPGWLIVTHKEQVRHEAKVEKEAGKSSKR